MQDRRPRKTGGVVTWNTLRIFQGRERRRWLWIVRRNRNGQCETGSYNLGETRW